MGKLAISGGSPVRSKPWPAWPIFDDAEERALVEALRTREWWYGKRVEQFEQEFAAFQDAAFGISCCNGSVALSLALRALGIAPGDEVIVPDYTFIATANAVAEVNAIPVFVDVEAETANMDLDAAEAAITPNTRAIIVVHFAGLPVDMDKALDIARRHKIALIEDAAHAWGSKWDGKGVGAIGDMGTFSFQVSKNITSGEGGIIISDNPELARAARSYTHCGRLEGEAWYEHFLLGGNYRITEFQAGLLLAQLKRLDAQTNLREKNAAILDAELKLIPGIYLPKRHAKVTRRSYHMYMVRYNAAEFGGLPRGQFIKALEAEGIPASPGYLHPVYGNVCYQTLMTKPRREQSFVANVCKERGIRYDKLHLPVAEKFCTDEMIWLPHSMLLGDKSEIEQVAEAFRKIHANQGEVAAHV